MRTKQFVFLGEHGRNEIGGGGHGGVRPDRMNVAGYNIARMKLRSVHGGGFMASSSMLNMARLDIAGFNMAHMARLGMAGMDIMGKHSEVNSDQR